MSSLSAIPRFIPAFPAPAQLSRKKGGVFLTDNRAAAAQRKISEPRGNAAVAQLHATAAADKIFPAEQPVQLARNKRIRGTVGGALGLGVTGALIGSVVPGIGTTLGGLVGLGVGALLGYGLSGPTIYPNLHRNEYQNELRDYRRYQRERQGARRAYEQGTIIRYSNSNSRAFTRLLHQGQVLYTYDVSNQLAIGSNAGPIKHAIVAGDQDVKAAGMANVILPTQGQQVTSEYEQAAARVEHLNLLREEFEERAKEIIKRRNVQRHTVDNIPNEKEKDIVREYFQTMSQLEHYE
ncbi:MAG TPA: hypothetical protein VFU15_10535, partial [Bacteroidia bacterium]|nr:hypothetical protein [Bacteroidia bacterium]